jgi:hypothetical protein
MLPVLFYGKEEEMQAVRKERAVSTQQQCSVTSEMESKSVPAHNPIAFVPFPVGYLSRTPRTRERQKSSVKCELAPILNSHD